GSGPLAGRWVCITRPITAGRNGSAAGVLLPYLTNDADGRGIRGWSCWEPARRRRRLRRSLLLPGSLKQGWCRVGEAGHVGGEWLLGWVGAVIATRMPRGYLGARPGCGRRRHGGWLGPRGSTPAARCFVDVRWWAAVAGSEGAGRKRVGHGAAAGRRG